MTVLRPRVWRLDRRVPDRDHREDDDARPFDADDNFSCAITFPRGMATAHLTCTAGVRKVIYTVHRDRGAVRVEDDDVEIASADPTVPRLPPRSLANYFSRPHKAP